MSIFRKKKIFFNWNTVGNQKNFLQRYLHYNVFLYTTVRNIRLKQAKSLQVPWTEPFEQPSALLHRYLCMPLSRMFHKRMYLPVYLPSVTAVREGWFDFRL